MTGAGQQQQQHSKHNDAAVKLHRKRKSDDVSTSSLTTVSPPELDVLEGSRRLKAGRLDQDGTPLTSPNEASATTMRYAGAGVPPCAPPGPPDTPPPGVNAAAQALSLLNSNSSGVPDQQQQQGGFQHMGMPPPPPLNGDFGSSAQQVEQPGQSESYDSFTPAAPHNMVLQHQHQHQHQQHGQSPALHQHKSSDMSLASQHEFLSQQPLQHQQQHPHEGQHHLQQHQHQHEQPQPQHICPTCTKGFPSRVSLTNHVQTVHAKKRSFECPTCSKRFSANGSLKRHVDTVHKRKREFQCMHCSKMFALKHHLKNHLITVHHLKNVDLSNVKPLRSQTANQAVAAHQRSHLQQLQDLQSQQPAPQPHTPLHLPQTTPIPFMQNDRRSSTFSVSSLGGGFPSALSGGLLNFFGNSTGAGSNASATMQNHMAGGSASSLLDVGLLGSSNFANSSHQTPQLPHNQSHHISPPLPPSSDAPPFSYPSNMYSHPMPSQLAPLQEDDLGMPTSAASMSTTSDFKQLLAQQASFYNYNNAATGTNSTGNSRPSSAAHKDTFGVEAQKKPDAASRQGSEGVLVVPFNSQGLRGQDRVLGKPLSSTSA